MPAKAGVLSRFIVALWGIPLLLVFTWLGGWWITALIGLISSMALFEYYKLQIRMDRSPEFGLGLAGCILICVAWQTDPANIVWLFTALFIVISTIGILKEKLHKDLISTLSGLLYIPLLLGTFIFIRNTETSVQYGQYAALGTLGSVWICDTFAFFGGKLIGKNPLAPNISPKKTVEGFVIGLLGAILFSASLAFLNLLPLDLALVVGFGAGLTGQIGDLIESKIKREAEIKDAGEFLSGHGGILDRFDSLIVAAPFIAMYLLVRDPVINLLNQP